MKILIYDDSISQSQQLAEMIKARLGAQGQIDIASTLDQAEKYLDSTVYQLIFLDIELDSQMDGISLASVIRQKSPETNLIFITAYIKYCEEIFVTAPEALILKPFTEQSVDRALAIVQKKLSKNGSISIVLGKRKLEKIELEQVSYIETNYRYLVFYDASYTKSYSFYDIKMRQIADRLPANFVRCHKSFCVNMNYIASLERFRFIMKDGPTIPISQNRYSQTKKIFLDYLEDVL